MRGVPIATGLDGIRLDGARAVDQKHKRKKPAVDIAVIERNGQGITTVRRGSEQRAPKGPVARAGGLLINGDFSDGLNGWSWSQSGGSLAPGEVVGKSGRAAFTEDDSFLISLQQSLVAAGSWGRLR